MCLISSPRNPRVCEWRKLRHPDLARSRSRVLLEGAHAVLQAIGSQHRVDTLLISPELAKPETVGRILQLAGPVQVCELSAEAFASLSERDGPSGIAAVIELHVGTLSPLSPAPGDVVLALWRVENPGNLGTIIRTANCFGARAVALVDRCTNPYSPLTAKASMGTILHTSLVTCRDLQELRAWCNGHGAALVGTSAHGSVQVTAWKPALPLVLLFGREGGGLPPEGRALCDYTVCIPMQGASSSLNLATAAGILTYVGTRTG